MNRWRVDSSLTFSKIWHRKDIVIFRNRLCRIDTKPPFLHVSACLRLKFPPQADSLISRVNFHPYFILIRFQNNCFVTAYPSSNNGSVDTQTFLFFGWCRLISLFADSLISRVNFHPYFILIRFQNNCFVTAYPSSNNGSVDTQTFLFFGWCHLVVYVTHSSQFLENVLIFYKLSRRNFILFFIFFFCVSGS